MKIIKKKIGVAASVQTHMGVCYIFLYEKKKEYPEEEYNHTHTQYHHIHMTKA